MAIAWRDVNGGESGSTRTLEDHFLTRFADAYLAEVRDFVHNIVHDKPLRVSGADGLRALAIAVAAENSYLQGKPMAVAPERLGAAH